MIEIIEITLGWVEDRMSTKRNLGVDIGYTGVFTL